MKEFRRLQNFLSLQALKANARRIFLQVITFSRQKKMKPDGLVKVLKMLPLLSNDDLPLSK